jgi:peroxiredoxin
MQHTWGQRGYLSRLAIAGAGLAGLALVGVLGVALSRGVGDSPLGQTEVGFDEAATFTLPQMNGEGDFALAEHADRPLFIYFWASWCRPCEEEAPVIQRLWPEYEARGYTFVGINIMDIESDAQDFLVRHDFTFPVLRDAKGSVYLEYGVYGLPEAFFVRPGLDVEAKYNGALNEDALRRLLDSIAEAP